MQSNKQFSGRCALIVGHPGHELRVWGWMRGTKPVVAVLTDGAGHGKRSRRLELSLDVLRAASASPSRLYGVSSDQAFYRSILDKDVDFFLHISDALAEMLIEQKIECVAGDAIEWYNPTHDLCRLLINRAIRIASSSTGKRIGNYEFLLVGHPKPMHFPAGHLRIDLSPAELANKLAEARGYAAAAGGILVAEIEQMTQQHGETAFGQEFLIPADASLQLPQLETGKPFYEIHGEKQVAAGFYQFVIRYREHIAPIARALQV
jgi:hypothetical protein